MINNGLYIYQIISSEEKTAKFGRGDPKYNCNGFSDPEKISGKVIIPDYIDGYRIVSLTEYSLRSCTKITDITHPSSLVEIEAASLTTLKQIKSLVIPASVVKIGNLIDYFYNLVEFRFEDNSRITSIGNYFLQHCLKLESIILPSSIASIGDGLCKNSPKLKFIRYCGIIDFTNIGNAMESVNDFHYVTVSLEYQGTSFGGKSIQKMPFNQCEIKYMHTICVTFHHFININIPFIGVFLL